MGLILGKTGLQISPGQGQVRQRSGPWEDAHKGRDPGSEVSVAGPSPRALPQGRTSSWEGSVKRESPASLVSGTKSKAGTQAQGHQPIQEWNWVRYWGFLTGKRGLNRAGQERGRFSEGTASSRPLGETQSGSHCAWVSLSSRRQSGEAGRHTPPDSHKCVVHCRVK